MEFFESAEQSSHEDARTVGASGFMGAHMNGNADIMNHSYAYREEATEAEGKIPTNFESPLAPPWPFNHIDPFTDPPLPDVKLSVTSPSIPQPVFSAAKKDSVSIFSLSSFYNPSGNGQLGHLKVIDATLRSAAAVFSLITFCVMTSTRETRMAAGSTFEVKFSDFQAYNYLVALNVLAFAYSSAQVVVIMQSNSSSVFTSPIRSGMWKYFCDEILAFCLFSASSSAATASELALHGLHNIWPPACSTWKLWMFCSKADAAIVISFFSSFSVILSSLFSGFHVLRLVALA